MEFLIKGYVNNLTEQNIVDYAYKNGVSVTDEETKIIYLYVKNYWQVFLKGNADGLFMELREKLRPNTYQVIVKLFNEYKSKM